MSENEKAAVQAGTSTRNRMREFRVKLGITQATMAGLIGVGQPTINSWESGKRNPTEDRIPVIEKCYRAKAKTLFAPCKTL